MLRAFKADAAPQKMHNAIGYDKIMPPCGIRPGGQKTYDPIRMAALYFLHGLGDPAAYFPAVGRVHPAFSKPSFSKPITGRRVK